MMKEARARHAEADTRASSISLMCWPDDLCNRITSAAHTQATNAVSTSEVVRGLKTTVQKKKRAHAVVGSTFHCIDKSDIAQTEDRTAVPAKLMTKRTNVMCVCREPLVRSCVFCSSINGLSHLFLAIRLLSLAFSISLDLRCRLTVLQTCRTRKGSMRAANDSTTIVSPREK